MALASIASVRSGLATNAATISELRSSATIRDAIAPPIFVVGEVSQVFDQAMARALDELLVTCRLYVSRADDRAGQDKLDGYLMGSGATSVKTAIESDKTLAGACQTLRLEAQSGYGVYDVAGTEYLGAEFTIRIWG